MATISVELLGRLIDAQARPLELFAVQWTDSPGDVVQEAFVRLIQQQPPPENPTSWLYRVVRNMAINEARSSYRRRHYERAAAAQTPLSFEPQESMGLDADEAAEALDRLPKEQREVIVARLWGQLTYDEIARIVNVSVSTAHRRYADGLATLRRTWIAHVQLEIHRLRLRRL